jgi:F-type H+-transporting ATPase subunit delta
MRDTRVASRYAKSLLDLALEQGALEKVYADMKMIHDTCAENADLTVFLKSPIIKTEKKRGILKSIFSGKVHPMTEGFIDLMTSRKRESYLEAIASAFLRQYKKYKQIITAVITTASGLDQNLRKQVMDIVKKSAHSEVELIEQVDSKLIGGFVLRIGDKQVDTSISRKLQELRREFSENPYVKEV